MFGWVSGIKSYLYIALAMGGIWLGAMVLGFVNDAMDNAAEVVRQQVTIELRDARISVLETEKDQIEAALALAEEERIALELRNVELRGIRDRALSAGEEDDGDIAPVLGDTLRSLSGN